MRSRKAQRGQGIVEYALIFALIVIVGLALLLIFGPQLGDAFSKITSSL
jgi:Flp pilus assembly pilin Flp